MLKKGPLPIVGVTPIAAHHPAVVDLTTCDSVPYEMRDDVHGVKYTKSGTEDWIQSLKGLEENDSSDFSASELDVSCSRKVKYTVRDGVLE